MIKTTKATASKNKTASEIDLFSDVKLSQSSKSELRSKVGDFLVEQILDYTGNKTSPIKGQGSYKGLSRQYRKYKKSLARGDEPNLELFGDMKDAIAWRETSKGVEVGVYGSEAPKADGHNNFSGESRIPTRQFLPEEGQDFKRRVTTEIEKMLKEAVARENKDQFSRTRLALVSSKRELKQVITEVLPTLSFTEARTAILSNRELTNLFAEFGLLKWL